MRLSERNRQMLATWLVTVIVLACGFAIYSYLYLEGRKHYFTERRLRELRLLGDEFKLRVENIGNNVLPNAADPSQEDSDCKDEATDGDIKTYVTTDTLQTRLVDTDPATRCQYSHVADRARLVPYFSLAKLVEYRKFTPSSILKVPPAVVPNTRVEVATAGEGATLLFTHQAPLTHKAPTHVQQAPLADVTYYAQKWRGSISANDLLGRPGEDSFDQVIVTESSGKVLFAFGTARPLTTDISSLVKYAVSGKSDVSGKANDRGDSASASAWAAVADSSSVVPVTLAGEDYLLFIQPMNISLTGTDSPGQLGQRTPLDWKIAGLIRKDHFTQESSGFSYSEVLVFLFVLLMAVFAEPFIKISSLGPMDRLSKWDAVFLSISAALSIGFLTFFLAGFYAYLQLESQVDGQLRKAADQIQMNFKQDLEKLLELLDTLSTKNMPMESVPKILERSNSADNWSDCQDATTGTAESSQNPAALSLKTEFEARAYFERIVWVDSGGKQQVKWTIYDTNTPIITVASRPYFTNVRDRLLFTKEIHGHPVSYWFGKIVSWNTGESLATLAVPAQPSCARSFFELTLDAILPSLRSVVLPPGYGFGVIDTDGTVLFHSDPTHHVNENFLQESDQDPTLVSAVFGRTVGAFDANYQGMGTRMYVRPIASPPWTLIVFYDKHYLRTSNLQILSLTLIAFLLTLIVQVPLLVLLWFQHPRWLWFNEARADKYPPYLAGMLGFILLFLIAALFASVVGAVYAGFLIPSIVLLATYFRFRGDGSDSVNRVALWRYVLSFFLPTGVGISLVYCCWKAGRGWECFLLSIVAALLLFLIFRTRLPLKSLRKIVHPSVQTNYLLSIGALLIVVSILPAMAFLHLAYQNELTLLLKHGQYVLGRSISARAERLRTEGDKIPGGAKYVDQRLGADPPDVYQSFFFAPSGSCDHEMLPATYGPLEHVVKQVRDWLLFDPLAVQSQGLYRIPPDEGKSEWRWDASMRCLSFTPSTELSSKPPIALIPVWWKPESFKWTLILILLAAACFGTVVLVTDFIAKRLFLLDVEIVNGTSKVFEPTSFAAEWDKSSRAEKLALYDFAEDGFLNHGNTAIQALLNRGILVAHPLRFANDKFRHFVLEKRAADKNVLPKNEEMLSLWQRIKWPLFVVVLGILTFLFVSQRKIFDVGVGFLAALAAAATAFFNLLDQVRGPRR